MLLAYGAENYFSFKEGIEVSFRLGKSCPKYISNGKKYTNLLCVKGANGSGKSNALNALLFIKSVICDSFSLKPEDEFRYKTFFSNNRSSNFFVDFLIDSIEYRYELELTSKKILSEVLYKKDKRMIPVLNRKLNKIVKNTREYSETLEIKFRSNASVISTSHQYEIESLEKIYLFFKNIFDQIVAPNLLIEPRSLNSISLIYYRHKIVFQFMKEFLSNCDVGIKDVQIETRVDENGKKIYLPIFIHENNKKEYPLPYSNESSGTKSLYQQLFLYQLVLGVGGILVLDEFDINLHPDILPKLINLFEDEKRNTKNAQLLFTTHNSEILNRLRKYRSVMVNKDQNESYIYRLDEIPGDILRNDRPIEPIYRSGKIGGVPKI